jgi:hypothetical protein
MNKEFASDTLYVSAKALTAEETNTGINQPVSSTPLLLQKSRLRLLGTWILVLNAKTRAEFYYF